MGTLAFAKQIYDKTLIKKPGLTPTKGREQCTGAAFDGAYFHLNSPDHLAKRIVEKAKGCPATRSEIRNLKEWLLCIWDLAHQLELVANDIRVDKLGVDVEIVFVPWYAQIPKDISSMYACCSYGKHYEELVQTTERLGRRWYAMIKFCEARFAQSELVVYKNFEKKYTTYRRTWGVDAEAVETEYDSATTTTTTTTTTTVAA